MWIPQAYLTFSSLVLAFVALSPMAVTQAALMERCGDCFCSPDSGSTCPTDESGIVDSLDLATNCVLESFVLTNDPDFLKLVSSTGEEECYPFLTTVGVIEGEIQTELPACVLPAGASTTENSTAVCAYKYNDADTTCVGRSYEILNYDSAAAAEADGAYVTHTGTCGVCSSAADFWIMLRDLNTFESTSVFCGTLYLLSGDANRFENMIECYAELGLSATCAYLWAHYNAFGVKKCSAFCLPEADGVTIVNEDPPTCEYAECIQCSLTAQVEFDLFSGRSLRNSGITERIIRPCSGLSRINHDYCVGTTEVGTCHVPIPTTAPQAAPTASSGHFFLPGQFLVGSWMIVTVLTMMNVM